MHGNHLSNYFQKGQMNISVLQFFEKLCLYSNEKNEIKENTGILYISHGIENSKYCLKIQLSSIVIC